MEKSAGVLEKEAHKLLAKGNRDLAHQRLKEAARQHRKAGNHRQASLCFSSAASIFGKVYTDTSYFSSAQLYEESAKEAVKYQDYQYASLQYKYAAVNYERDGDHFRFSDCFYLSKDCRRKAIMSRLRHNKIKNFSLRLKSLYQWGMMSLSCLIWGYGERPLRTLSTAVTVIILSTFVYYFTGLMFRGDLVYHNLLQSFYFSVSAMTPLASGDISCTDISRPVAIFEGFCGIIVAPMFIVGLSRKFLRL